MTENIDGTVLVTGSVNKTLDILTLSSDGSIGTVVAIASLDKSLDSISTTLSGEVLDSAILNKTLGSLTDTIVGNVVVNGTLSYLLGSLAIVSSGTAFYPAMNQEGFRFRNDDGSESTATWMETQDTDTKTSLEVPFRLRMLVDSDSITDSDFQIEYRKLLSASPVLWGEWKRCNLWLLDFICLHLELQMLLLRHRTSLIK